MQVLELKTGFPAQERTRGKAYTQHASRCCCDIVRRAYLAPFATIDGRWLQGQIQRGWGHCTSQIVIFSIVNNLIKKPPTKKTIKRIRAPPPEF